MRLHLVTLYLISVYAACAQPTPQLLPRPQPAHTFTIQAIAKNGQISVPSNQVSTTNSAVILAWNHPDTNSLQGFKVNHVSGKFTNSVVIGNVLSTAWPIIKASNTVIQIASSLTITNPTAPAMFFALCYRTNLLKVGWIPVAPATITRTNL